MDRGTRYGSCVPITSIGLPQSSDQRPEGAAAADSTASLHRKARPRPRAYLGSLAMHLPFLAESRAVGARGGAGGITSAYRSTTSRKGDRRMSSATVLRMGALAGLLMLSTVACSSTTRLSSTNMCKAAGGTYSQVTCQRGGNPLSAQKMCEAHGGTYFSGGDYCEEGGSGLEDSGWEVTGPLARGYIPAHAHHC